MIQLGIILALVTSLLGGGVFIVRSIKESGRAECRAEHQEAARMAELRSRERGDESAKKFQRQEREIQGREREVIRDLARTASDGNCLSDGVFDSLNNHLREARGPGEPDSTVRGASGHSGQK